MNLLPLSSRASANERLRQAGNVGFTENKGQVSDMDSNPRPDILFTTDGNGGQVYLRKTGVSYVLNNIEKIMHEINMQVESQGLNDMAEMKNIRDHLLRQQIVTLHRVDFDFVNANPNARVETHNKLEGYSNYYYAHLPSEALVKEGAPQGITNVNSFNRVIQKNIYNHIDVIYYGVKAQGLKYDIIVNPGGDPNEIKIKYAGCEKLDVQSGKLKMETSLGELNEWMPKVYQTIGGRIIDVDAEYILEESILSFKFGTFNPEFPLVIDPWATYYGGSSYDAGTDIVADNSGNIIITGETFAANFPVLGGSQMSFSLLGDAFVVKFDAAGNRMWATYYGGSSRDLGESIASDNLGNIFITGFTNSNNLPVPGGFYTVYKALGDVFVAKFDPLGLLTWATYYGGDDYEMGNSTATDNSGNIYITGYTSSANFPTVVSAGAYSQPYGNGVDAFIVKFNSLGTPVWATFYGDTGDDLGNGIAIDVTDNVVITGNTKSVNFPVLTGFQMIKGSGQDAFVVKFNPSGVRSWATFFGGGALDFAYGITTDLIGNIIFVGYTTSANFPVWNGYQMNKGASEDAFVVKLTPQGNRDWATFYGANVWDWGKDVVTDGSNNIYLLMEAEDIAAPASLVDACAWQPVFNGGGSTSGYPEDQIIVKFSTAGQKLCATFMGGTGEDDLEYGGGITVYGNLLFLTGETTGGYPVTAGAFQTTYAGGNKIWGVDIGFDAFVSSLCTNICEAKILGLDFNAGTTTACVYTPINYSSIINNSCDTTGYQYQWTFTGGTPSNSTLANPSVSYAAPGNYSVKLVLITLCKTDSVTKANYITINGNSNTSSIQNICQGQSAQIHGISQNISGVYTQTFTAANGCDSTSSVTLAVNNSSSTIINPIACNSYTHNGQAYNNTGIYTQTLVNTVGCDSILTINLTINNNINSSSTQNICFGQSAIIHGINQTVPGIYSQTFTSSVASGACDSVSTITLIVNSITSASISPIACDNYTHNGQLYNSSGVYTQTLTNVAGCDSMLTINLTIHSSISTSDTQYICYGESVLIHGVYQNVAGAHSQSFVATNGCDSTSTIILIVYPAVRAAFAASPQPATLNDPAVYFTNQSTEAINYLWNFGNGNNSNETHPIHRYEDTGYYHVTLIAENKYGCVDSVAQLIFIGDAFTFYIPNAFTPGNGEPNNTFNGKGLGISKYQLWIFDRWGNQIYTTGETENPNHAIPWDGKANGGKDIAQQDVYVWMVSIIDVFDKKHRYSGHVTLLR